MLDKGVQMWYNKYVIKKITKKIKIFKKGRVYYDKNNQERKNYEASYF